MGGKDKGSDYSVLNRLLGERVRRVYTIGAAARKIESQLASSVPITSSGTLGEAIRAASGNARPGEIVLLAPACSSFDQFHSYEERGRAFKAEVRALEAPSGGR